MFDVQGWLTWLLDGLWNLVRDAGYAAIIMVQDLILMMVSAVAEIFNDTLANFFSTVGSTFSVQHYWSMLPVDVRAMLNAVMIPQALALVASAWGVKRMLKLIALIRG